MPAVVAPLVAAAARTKAAKGIGKTILASTLGLLLVVAALVMLGSEQPDPCTTGDPTLDAGAIVGPLPAGAKSIKSLDDDQLRNAQLVIAQGRRDGVKDHGIVVALAAALQESRLRNYANDGTGKLRRDQQGIAASLKLPHEAVGRDHGSIGIFQQQWPWWGSMADLMDPARSAAKFYAALKRVRGWESLPVTVAAQRVQHSLYPTAYADDESLAEQLLAKIDPNGATSSGSTVPAMVPGTSGQNVVPAAYRLGSVTPQLTALVNVLGPMFGVKTVGGYRASARDPGGHPAGLAADFMTSSKTQGDQLAAYARSHASDLGIDYVIWRQRIWSTTRAGDGWRPMSDRGSATENHMDHVHINVKRSASATAIAAANVAGSAGLDRSTDPDCLDTTGAYGVTGTIHWPLPVGSFTDRRNWRSLSALRASWHTGTDLSSPCGTEVMAANSGVVRIRTDESWAGPALVQVQVAPGQLTTWYAHMRQVDVRDGQIVTAGQRLGQVGDLGNATGCHLHFEVHTKGGSIYGADNTNPSVWLKNNVGKNLGGAALVAYQVSGSLRPGRAPAGQLRLVSFNALGDNHWRDHPGMRRGAVRAARTVGLLDRWGADVAGLQEMQGVQRDTFARVAAGRYAMWPRSGLDAENAIVWNTSTMRAVRRTTVAIPYFHGAIRHMPVILFQQVATGRTGWVINVHNPADVAWARHQQGFRNEAITRERTLISRLRGTGRPVFLTGDLNDFTKAFCPLTAGGLTTAAQGGSNTSRCTPPAKWTIDWVLGAGPLTWTGYANDASPRSGAPAGRISDHPIIITQAILR